MITSIDTSYPAESLLVSTDQAHLDAHAHSVQFYGHDEFLIDELSRFIGSALRKGDAGIIIATQARHR